MSKEYPCVYYDNEKCKKYDDPEYVDWCVLGPCPYETPSNADRIRTMTDEELAEFLEGDYGNFATGCAIEWLKAPAKGDEQWTN